MAPIFVPPGEPSELLNDRLPMLVWIHSRSCVLLASLLLACGILLPSESLATERPQDVPEQANIVERLDTLLDLNLRFRDQHGNVRSLSSLFINERPLILAPVYFECPRLCKLTQASLARSLNAIELEIGREYKVVSFSFDPEEPAELAAKRAEKYHALLKNSSGAKNGGWDFLVGEKSQTEALTKALGFSFFEDRGEYIHAAMFVVLTPDGRISRYFYGVDFPPKNLRLALVEAARGKIGNTYDKVFLYCFRFDPTKGKYTLAIWNITRVICATLFLLLVGFLISLRLREGRLRKERTADV